MDRKNAPDILSSYVNTYIKEEIKEEGIVRSLPPFLRFLGIAGLLNGQLVNGQNIAGEAAVPRSSVDVYFSILEDSSWTFSFCLSSQCESSRTNPSEVLLV